MNTTHTNDNARWQAGIGTNQTASHKYGSSLPAALQPLAAYRQFIVYRLAPGKVAGKLDKLPTSPHTGLICNAHDSVNWGSYADAATMAQVLGPDHGVGFVLTAADPIFCVDIDSCLQPDGQWSPLAQQVRAMFPTAAVERSVSGKGLHIWGTYSGPTPPHGCKNTAFGIELYTEGRFIALGAPDAVGNVTTDCTSALHAAIAQYFPPSGAAAVGGDLALTDAPVPEWRGPSDDADLIRRALASRSAAAAFGQGCSFADLWYANAEALGRAYPAQDSRPYDASSADAALASHLAFWTGKHGVRIECLMKQSALARDKWDREDYLPRTIAAACGHGGGVYVDEAVRRREQLEESMRIGDGSDEIRLAGAMPLDEMLPRFVFIQDGQQVVDLHQPQHVAVLSDWKATFKASQTTLEVKGQFNADGTQKTKTYETAALWEKSPARQIAQAVTFLAGGKRIVRDPRGREAVNTWHAPDRTTPPGDPSPFLQHVAYLFGDDAPRFLDWLAHIEQRPGELPQFGWLHISDWQGTGRNWIASVIARLWPGYAAVNFDLSRLFASGFNDRLSARLIVVVDEIDEGGNAQKWRNAELMKSLLNEGQRTINPKFGHIREEWNACRWLIFSNHRSALALNESDRRFNVVLRDGQPMGADYYQRLYAVLKDPSFVAGVAQLLRTRDLSQFNPGAHAVLTDAKRVVIAANRSEADDILRDVAQHWPADVIPSSTLGELLTGSYGGTITRAHHHALERQGVKSHPARIRLGATAARVTILRNVERWQQADANLIRAELARCPPIAPGAARTFLDNLSAV